MSVHELVIIFVTTLHPYYHIHITQDITDAQVAINELFGKIHDIKTKASQSEKNHLQSTITSLKRLQMLITAVSQLEVGEE